MTLDEDISNGRKIDIILSEKLARIETIVENIEKQISSQFDSISQRQMLRDKHCSELEEKVTSLRIEQGKQGVRVGMFSVIVSSMFSAVTAYFIKK